MLEYTEIVMEARVEILNTIAKNENKTISDDDVLYDIILYVTIHNLLKNPDNKGKVLISPKTLDRYSTLKTNFTKQYNGWDVTKSNFVSYLLHILEDAKQKVKNSSSKAEKRYTNEVSKLIMDLILLNRINLKSASYNANMNSNQLKEGIEYYINLLDLEFDVNDTETGDTEKYDCNQKASIYSPLSIEKCKSDDILNVSDDKKGADAKSSDQLYNMLQLLSLVALNRNNAGKINDNALELVLDMMMNLAKNTSNARHTQKQNALIMVLDLIKNMVGTTTAPSTTATAAPSTLKPVKPADLNIILDLLKNMFGTNVKQAVNTAVAKNDLSLLLDLLKNISQTNEKTDKQQKAELLDMILQLSHQLDQSHAKSTLSGGGAENVDNEDLYISDANYVKMRKFENDFKKYDKRIEYLKSQYKSLKQQFHENMMDNKLHDSPDEYIKEIDDKIQVLEQEKQTIKNKEKLDKEDENKIEGFENDIKNLKNKKEFYEKINARFLKDDTIDDSPKKEDNKGFDLDAFRFEVKKQLVIDITKQKKELDNLEDLCKMLDNIADELYKNEIKVSIKELKKFVDELNKSQVLPYDDDVKRLIKELVIQLEYFSDSNTNFDIFIDFTNFRGKLTEMKMNIEKTKKKKEVDIASYNRDISQYNEKELLTSDKRQVLASPAYSSPERRELKYGGSEDFLSFNKLFAKIQQLKQALREYSDTSGNKSIATTMKVPSLYEDIWDEYVKLNRYAKNSGNLPIYADDMLFNKLKQHNLDPAVVLKLNFSDRIIFIITMFFIRLILVIFIELLIDYNILRSLEYTIAAYGILYIVFLICLILVINYDAYKLRILINYLNMHVNSTKIFLHVLLFVIFMALVYIMIKSNETLSTFGDLFDFTHIYKQLYDITETSKTDSDNRLSQDEKLKLQYRVDIITMIVFIFTAFLVLVI